MVRKNTPAPDAWSGPAQEDALTENLAAPVIRHSAKSRRTKVRLLKANLILIPPLLGACLLVTVGNAQAEPPRQQTVSSVTVNSSAGKAAAMTAINRWLSRDPSPLPGGRVLGWDGYTSSKVASTKTSSGGTIEIHRFTLAAERGEDVVLYDSTVEVTVLKNGIASVPSSPTLLPRLDGTDSTTTSTDVWPGWTTATATEAIDSAVSAWAEAFTSGDPDALRLAIGDKSAKRGYIPFSGVNAGNVRATSVAYKAAPDAPASDKPGTVIARVEFSLLWQGHGVKDAQAPAASYDVLIVDAASASPRIVAWGGPGSGPSLKPYQNAVRASLVGTKNDVDEADSFNDDEQESSR